MSCTNLRKRNVRYSTDIEDLGRNTFTSKLIPEHQRILYCKFSQELCSIKSSDQKIIERKMKLLRRKYKISPSKSKIRQSCEQNNIEIPENLIEYLIKKKSRSMSGVVVVAVTSPPMSSCSYNCSFCPSGKNSEGVMIVPKSYDPKEPAIARGLRNNFNGYLQFYERGDTYIANGHYMDKVELIVRGGTWHCYPERIQIRFITEVYYGANTFYDHSEGRRCRDMLSLDEEVELNKTAKCRIIGLTLETRPDFGLKNFSELYLYPDDSQIQKSFNMKRLRRIIINLRRFGCTRIEFGIQHTDNDILANVNRESTIEDAIFSIKLMKNCGFKIVGHWMPDLPNSSYEDDMIMFNKAIYSSELQLDDWKIYPTATTRDSEILDWYNDGTYTPYSEIDLNVLIRLCIYVKKNIPKWIRIDRLTRDIPSTSMEAGYEKKTNLRQIIHERMKKTNDECKCLRCKEVKGRTQNIKNAKLCVSKYRASEGNEYFISYESCSCRFCWKYYLFVIYQFILLYLLNINVFWSGCKNYNICYGFCRLRLSREQRCDIFPELRNASFVRELKVYGRVVPHFIKNKTNRENKKTNDKTNGKTNGKIVDNSQHMGFGKKLMREAERISRYYRYSRISVINGIGTEEYYVKKLGYQTNKHFVTKNLF